MPARGVFGGSFDPPHVGHLIIAEHIARRRRLDTVMWVPAKNPPHKDPMNLSPAEDRVEMVRLAIEGNPLFELSTIEMSDDQPPYSVNLLETLQQKYPDDKLYFILGGDSLYELPTWKDYTRLWQLAEICVTPRPGWNIFAVDRDILANVRIVRCPMMNISANWIRELVRRGESIRYLVPEPVREYIMKKKLFI